MKGLKVKAWLPRRRRGKEVRTVKVKGGCSREGAKARREGKGFQRQRLARAEALRKDDKKLEVKGGCSRQDAKTLREGEGI